MNFKIIFAAAALLATQSFAIAGIGAHYTPAVGTSLNEAKRSEIFKGQDKLQFSHGNFDYIQGFGFKAWVDLLPFIDIEGTFNIQFASYNASLWAMRDDGTFKEIPMEIELGGTPFAKATPKYIAMNADISVTYPFSIPLFPIRPYVGGGLTMHWNTFVLNKAFVANVIKSIGIHLLAGVRFKLPIIPIAAYANVKCYLGGDYDDDIDAGHFAFELGGGFAL